MSTTMQIDARAAILALQHSPSTRWTGRIGVLLHEIEAVFGQGVSRAQVHETLKACGIGISFEGFKKALYRLRKRQRELLLSQVQPAVTSAHSPAPTPAGTTADRTSEVRPSATTTVSPPLTPVSAPTVAPPLRIPQPLPVSHALGSPGALEPNGWRPGSIGEIARSQPDMRQLAKEGREYTARLAAEKKRKADEAKGK